MERFPGVTGDFEPGAEDPGDKAGKVGRVAPSVPASAGLPLVATVGHVPGLTKRDDDNGWVPASQPPTSDQLVRSIAVMGVIDDANYRMNGEQPFADVVHYWPANRQWTITHVCRADKDADDFPVTVRCWQPIVELPPPWSALWD